MCCKSFANKFDKNYPKEAKKYFPKIARPKGAGSNAMDEVDDGTSSQGSSSWSVHIVPHLARIIKISDFSKSLF